MLIENSRLISTGIQLNNYVGSGGYLYSNSTKANNPDSWKQSISELHRKTNQNLGREEQKSDKPKETFQKNPNMTIVDESASREDMKMFQGRQIKRPSTALLQTSFEKVTSSLERVRSKGKEQQPSLHLSKTEDNFLNVKSTSLQEVSWNVASQGRLQRLEDLVKLYQENISKEVKLQSLQLRQLESEVSKLKQFKNPQKKESSISIQEVDIFLRGKLQEYEIAQEERIMQIESSVKKLGNKLDSKTTAIVNDTSLEFHNIKSQFELYGETLYHRLSNEFAQSLEGTLKRFELELASSMRQDSTSILMEGVRDYEKKIMTLEGMMEDLKITQDAAVDELSKFQIKIEMKVEREIEDMDRKVMRIAQDLEKGEGGRIGHFDNNKYAMQRQVEDQVERLEQSILKQLQNKAKPNDQSDLSLNQFKNLEAKVDQFIQTNKYDQQLHQQELIKLQNQVQLLEKSLRDKQLTQSGRQTQQYRKSSLNSMSNVDESYGNSSQKSHQRSASKTKHTKHAHSRMSNQSNFIKIEDMNEEEQIRAQSNEPLQREESMSLLPQPELSIHPAKPQKVTFYHNHVEDDEDDDDLTPHAYDFSEPNKIDPQSKAYPSHNISRWNHTFIVKLETWLWWALKE
ncbi:hypothetical protein FGO68_gene12992 [Halteria grandinella]|uniref:Uncharacterized protein n=1 Tax=Halteria grandinella TaxID=5974 RepID=A0A8J8NYN0_HALGN|nr:hypothetical protein FGO68_gene12992 [Halteria grandinella]